MKFDVIIGNPPYNDDLYIEFILHGIKFLKPDGNMIEIVPAKWQGKGDEVNKRFRDKVIPLLKEIVNFIDTCDIWPDLQIPGGVCYFNLENMSSNGVLVTNRCKMNKNFDGSCEQHDETEITLLNKEIIEIINKSMKFGSICDDVSFRRCEFVEEAEAGVATRDSENNIELCNGGDGRYTPAKIAGYISKYKLKTSMNIEKYKCIQGIKTAQGGRSPFDADGLALGSNLITVLKPYQVPKGTYQVLKYFDTEIEALSFQSVYLSKLCSFLQLVAVVGQTQTREFWRFQPKVEKFDHIYTDMELYDMFGLNTREREIIETTIRERKR